MDARDKLRAEAGPTESKVILDWDFDFTQLIISLPENKFVAWTTHASQLLSNKTTIAKKLESTIGRLVVPGVHKFVTHLLNLQQMATHCHSIKISKTCRSNLLLMLRFLDIEKWGIGMNLIAFRRPTHVYQSDSCRFGLGGYLDKGFVWRFKLPEELCFRASNNLLKYITSIISPWMDMLAGRLNQCDCALLMTNSSTSVGWLLKTNFWEIIGDNTDLIQAQDCIETVQHHTTLFLKASIKEYFQWFPGKEYNFTNTLSHDFDRSACEIIKILLKTGLSQLPQHFQIAPLPNKISLWLTALLLKLPAQEQ
jgi:hypothetical protein